MVVEVTDLAPLRLDVPPIGAEESFRDRAYAALKRAIADTNVYAGAEPVRLEERQLARDLGISRTPIREAFNRLEQEGLLRSVPRRGIFVVKKTKHEILEMITLWAALEGMAARLVALGAAAGEIAGLRRLFQPFDGETAPFLIDEYSEANVRFHQAIVGSSGCRLLIGIMENLFFHMRWIRERTIGERDRRARSMIDHLYIIEAIEARDAERAERLVKQHSLDLARHVEEHVHFLD